MTLTVKRTSTQIPSLVVAENERGDASRSEPVLRFLSVDGQSGGESRELPANVGKFPVGMDTCPQRSGKKYPISRFLYPAYNAMHGRHPRDEVATIPHTAGIRDAGTFRRRIMKLIQKPIEVGGPQGVALMLAYAAFGLATLFGALSLRANAADTPVKASTLAHGFIRISCRPVAEHPGMTPGHLVSGIPPLYPDEARKAGIEGTAVLSATITKSGTIENLKALSGPKDLQQATLEAVRQSQYEPYLLNGKPIAVRVEIKAVYSLGASILLPKL
jgi:TonB family protein